ncbi:MAG: hypothetical protein WA821_09585 [Anaerolineales bacterium]
MKQDRFLTGILIGIAALVLGISGGALNRKQEVVCLILGMKSSGPSSRYWAGEDQAQRKIWRVFLARFFILHRQRMRH